MLRDGRLDMDGDFSTQQMLNLANSDLSGKLGNLLLRVINKKILPSQIWPSAPCKGEYTTDIGLKNPRGIYINSSWWKAIPNWFEDISGTIELKLKSLEVYKSEMREWPHARSIKAVEHLAKWRGATVGCEAAEAFMLIREVK